MNKTIDVEVRNKIATQTNDTVYVCGNSDFVVNFDFDDEWAEHEYKTARFVFDGKFVDAIFSGNECSVPVISDTYKIKVGVYVGDLKTSTPALVIAKKSILCGGGTPVPDTPDVYGQMMEVFNASMEQVAEVNQKADATEHAKLDAQAAQAKAEEAEEGANQARNGIEEALTAATAERKAAEQARQGAEAALQTVEEGFVSYTAQNKTDEEKAQARKNIGAVETCKTVLGDTITWDGETDSRVHETDDGDHWHRVHNIDGNDVLNNIELFKNAVAVNSDGTEYRLHYQDEEILSYGSNDAVIVALKDGAYYPTHWRKPTFPKKGIYFYPKSTGTNGTTWVASFTVPGFTFVNEKLDRFCLPDTAFENGDPFLILTSAQGHKYKVSVSVFGASASLNVELI